jgi:vancomycin resistance protein YoaR
VGFEAAVYDPGVDLKMKNDTGGPIMLRTVNNRAQRRLEIQVWGLPQSRKVSVSGATILSRTPHPRALYLTTPRLRPGQTRQVDWAADGYNLFITRTIRDASGVRTDRVSTKYKPWQAVFEVGGSRAAPRPSTTTPASSPVKAGGGST